MEQKLKQRVVGAAVLVALGVVFIPILLDEGRVPPPPQIRDMAPMPPDDLGTAVAPLDEHASQEIDAGLDASPDELAATSEDTAAAPVVSEPPAATAVPPATTNTRPAVKPAAEPVRPVAPAATSAKPPVKPVAGTTTTAAATPTTGSWVVQLGAFGSADNAAALTDKLKKGGFPAFVDKLGDRANPSFRVRVGPAASRAKAEEIRARLAKDFAISGILLRYP